MLNLGCNSKVLMKFNRKGSDESKALKSLRPWIIALLLLGAAVWNLRDKSSYIPVRDVNNTQKR